MAEGIVLKIFGDDSPFRKTMAGLGNTSVTALKGLGIATAALSGAVSALGIAGVKYNATIEQLQTSFSVMTGSAEKASETVERLRKMGAETPFELPDLAKTTQLLMNYGFTADRAVEEMAMLGDISQGNAEAMNSIALGYAQMSSLGKVNLQDIKQMINGGFNPLQEISVRTGESMESLYDRISKGKLAVSEITESMKAATSEGGRYFKSMEAQSQTFNGLFSTMKDNANELVGAIFKPISESLTSTVMPEIIATMGEFKDALSIGGLEGFFDSIMDKVPALIERIVGAFMGLAQGIIKRLPELVKKIVAAVPSILKGAFTALPEIVGALFEIVSNLISELILQLPQLVPMILEGLVKIGGKILVGIVDIIGGIFTSIRKLLGLKAGSLSESINDALDSVDPKRQKEISTDIDLKMQPKDGVSYTQKVKDEMTEITNALSGVEGIDDATKQAIIDAIVNGIGGSNLFSLALSKIGLNNSQQEQINIIMDKSRGKLYNKLTEFDWLTETQKTEIQGLIGKDYADVYDELVKMGFTPGQIITLQNSITGVNNELANELRALGLTENQIAMIKKSLGNDKASIETMLQMLGVDQTTIDTILASYDTVSGSVAAKLQNLTQSIVTTLTDGKADTPEIKQGLLNRVKEFVDEQVAGVNRARDEALANLKDLNLPLDQYNKKAGEINNLFDGYILEWENLSTAYTAFINENAELSTEEVNKRVQELYILQGKAEESAAFVSALTEGQKNGQRALVVAGAVKDPGTQGAVIGTESKNYADAVARENEIAGQKLLDAQETYKNDAAEYKKQEALILGDLETQKAILYNNYINGLNEIMNGVMQAYPDIQAKLREPLENQEKGDLLQTLIDQIVGDGKVTLSDEQLTRAAESMGMSFGELQTKISDALLLGDTTQISDELATKRNEFYQLASETFNDPNFEFGDFGAVFNEALSKGFFDNIEGIDLTNGEEKFRLMLGMLVTNAASGLTEQNSTVEEKAQEVGSTASENMKDTEGAKTSGNETVKGYVQGILLKLESVRLAGSTIGKAFIIAVKKELGIASPSKEMMKLGEFSGEGFNIGLRDTIKKSNDIVSGLLGNVNASYRLAMPDITGAVTVALDGSDALKRPIYLNVDGKRIASVLVDDNRAAIVARNRRIALGVGGG